MLKLSVPSVWSSRSYGWTDENRTELIGPDTLAGNGAAVEAHGEDGAIAGGLDVQRRNVERELRGDGQRDGDHGEHAAPHERPRHVSRRPAPARAWGWSGRPCWRYPRARLLLGSGRCERCVECRLPSVGNASTEWGRAQPLRGHCRVPAAGEVTGTLSGWLPPRRERGQVGWDRVFAWRDGGRGDGALILASAAGEEIGVRAPRGAGGDEFAWPRCAPATRPSLAT